MKRGSIGTALVATVVIAGCGDGSQAAPAPKDPMALPTAAAPAPTATAAPTSTTPVSVPNLTTVASDEIELVIAGPVRRGQSATVTARSAPDAECTIRVTSPAGSAVGGLDVKNADGSGAASWTWTLDAAAMPGSWPVEVTCSLVGYSGQRAVARGTLRVK